nr:hypothetical protein [Ceratocystis fimbriata]
MKLYFSYIKIIRSRKIIKSSNKLVGVGKQVGVQLVDENGNVFKTLYSISDCAKYFGLSRTLIYSRIQKKWTMNHEPWTMNHEPWTMNHEPWTYFLVNHF